MIRFLTPLKRALAAVYVRVTDRLRQLSPARKVRKQRIAAALKEGRMVVAKVSPLGCRMNIPPRSYLAGMYVDGRFEPLFLRFLKASLGPGMTCVDIGANVGIFSLVMAKAVGRGGRVFSFEPTDETYALLKGNIALNHCDNIIPENVALFDRDGMLDFQVGPPGFEVYNSAGTFVSHPAAGDTQFSKATVSCRKLDSYCNERGVAKVDFIKIDIEGAELHALKGMESLLKANKHVTLAVEIGDQTTRGFGYAAGEIAGWLTARGWSLFDIRPSGRLVPVPQDREAWTGNMIVARQTVSG